MFLKISPRAQFIGAAVFVVVVLGGVTVGLVLGLRTPPPPNGGSPTLGPPDKGTDTTEGPVGKTFPDSATGNYQYATVQTHTNICSAIGKNILAAHRGNAVDAAIASVLCVGVVNAHSCGIGGGFFMTLLARPKGSSSLEANTIISRETAPLNATEDMYVNDTESSSVGGMSIGVPGEVAGLYKAWQLYGSVPWKDLVLPTAEILEHGYKVEAALADAIKERTASINDLPNLKEVFFNEDGTPKVEGDIYKDAKLAKTFRKIAEDPLSFYNGSLARDIVDDIQEQGGIITLQDLQQYSARVRTPVTSYLSNLNITSFSPTSPSSGHILQFVLKLLDGYNFGPDDIKDTSKKVLTYHRFTEILKFAYAKRSALGDEEFVNNTELIANLTSDAFVSATRQMINDSFTQDINYYGPAFEMSDHGTAHLSIVAPDGSAVAVTSTINLYFGSKVRGSKTGILFNDEMDDFSTPGATNSFGLPPSPSNFITPGKMPMSSMVPSIFMDGNNKVVMVTGGTGGTKITSQIAFVAFQHLYLKKDLRSATDSARIHHQLVPNIIQYEPFLEKDVLEGLKAKGHEVSDVSKIGRIGSIADVCTAPCTGTDCFTRTCFVATSDGRKGGAPDGY